TLAASSASSAASTACRKSERMPPSSSRSSTSPAASCMAYPIAKFEFAFKREGQRSGSGSRRLQRVADCRHRPATTGAGLGRTRRLLGWKLQPKNADLARRVDALRGRGQVTTLQFDGGVCRSPKGMPKTGEWCGREESNLHEQAHSDLNAARLPF